MADYFVRFFKWNELIPIINESSADLIFDSVFQSLEYLSITGIGKRFNFSKPRILRNVKEMNAIQYTADNQICAVAPLLINHCNKTVVFRGFYTHASPLGLIYSNDWSYDAFSDFIHAIQTKYPKYAFCSDRVLENTRLCDYLLAYSNEHNLEHSKTTCVSICISGGYDNWYQSLSKNTRQHIRQCYNRISKDNVHMEVKCIRGGNEKTLSIWKRMLLFSEHTLYKSDISFGVLYKLVHFAEAVNKFFDPMTKALNKLKQSFQLELYLNGELAAFLSGFVSEGNVIIFPRLSVNSKFSSYSAGILVHCEAIKYLSDNTQNNLNIDYLDLGIAYDYKYKYGASDYFDYSFRLPAPDAT